ncbi:MAG: hemolysin family protein [Microbacteriaceae bacterium]
MEPGTLVDIGLVLLFILIGGVFAGTELAIVSLRESQVKAIEQGGKGGARIAELVGNPNRFLSAVQIGVTLAGFFSSAYGASTIAPSITPVLEGWGMSAGAAGTTAFIGLTLVIAYFSLVFGELVPKRLAMQHPVAFTKVLAPPLNALATLMRPAIWLLSASTNLVVRLLGSDPHAASDQVTEEEVRQMIDSNEYLPDERKLLLTDVFRASDRRLSEVMRPRPDVTFVEQAASVDEVYRLSLQLGYSRFPLIDGDVDDVRGFVHVRDLMAAAANHPSATTTTAVSTMLRPILALPASNTVLDALARMRGEGHHIAVVIDEYGGTDGIVTMEDLVEELVGEIYDEYDRDRDPEDSSLRRGDVLEVDGGLAADELATMLDAELPEGRYDTVAGLVLEQLGHLAQPGDVVELEEHLLEVVAVDGHRIERVAVRERPKVEDETEA